MLRVGVDQERPKMVEEGVWIFLEVMESHK
jgi:hypothetical protein